jgi:hypothetical protein
VRVYAEDIEMKWGTPLGWQRTLTLNQSLVRHPGAGRDPSFPLSFLRWTPFFNGVTILYSPKSYKRPSAILA